jgi:hypothetical protein
LVTERHASEAAQKKKRLTAFILGRGKLDFPSRFELYDLVQYNAETARNCHLIAA